MCYTVVIAVHCCYKVQALYAANMFQKEIYGVLFHDTIITSILFMVLT